MSNFLKINENYPLSLIVLDKSFVTKPSLEGSFITNTKNGGYDLI